MAELLDEWVLRGLKQQQYIPHRLLGEGANGYVFSLQFVSGFDLEIEREMEYRHRVLKIMQKPTKSEKVVRRWRNEYNNMKRMAREGVAPKIHGGFLVLKTPDGKRCCGYVMDRMQQSLYDCLSDLTHRNVDIHAFVDTAFEQVARKYNKLLDLDMFCVDLKLSNIMVNIEESPLKLTGLRFVDLDGQYCRSDGEQVENPKRIYTFLTVLNLAVEAYIRFNQEVLAFRVLMIFNYFSIPSNVDAFKTNFDALCVNETKCFVLPYVTYMRELIKHKTGVSIANPYSVVLKAITIMVDVFAKDSELRNKVVQACSGKRTPKKKTPVKQKTKVKKKQSSTQTGKKPSMVKKSMDGKGNPLPWVVKCLRDDYDIALVRELGKGANGVVYSFRTVDDSEENTVLAIKIMRKPAGSNNSQEMKNFLGEFKRMESVYDVNKPIVVNVFQFLSIHNRSKTKWVGAYMMKRMDFSLHTYMSNLRSYDPAEVDRIANIIYENYRWMLLNTNYACVDMKLANILVNVDRETGRVADIRFADLDSDHCFEGDLVARIGYQKKTRMVFFSIMACISLSLEAYSLFRVRFMTTLLEKYATHLTTPKTYNFFKEIFDFACNGTGSCIILPYKTYLRTHLSQLTGKRYSKETPFEILGLVLVELAEKVLGSSMLMNKLMHRFQITPEMRKLTPKKKQSSAQKKPAKKRSAKSLVCKYNIREESDIAHITKLLGKLKEDDSVFCTAQHAGSKSNEVFVRKIIKFASDLVGNAQTDIEFSDADSDAAVALLRRDNSRLSRSELKFLVNHCIRLMEKRLKRPGGEPDKRRKTKLMKALLSKYILPGFSGQAKAHTAEEKKSVEDATRELQRKMPRKKSGSKKSAGKGRKQNKGKITTRINAFYLASLAAKVLSKEDFDKSGLNMAAKPQTPDENVLVFESYDHAKSMFYITHKILMHSSSDMRRFWEDVETVNGGPLKTRYGSSFEDVLENLDPLLETIESKVEGTSFSGLQSELITKVAADSESLEAKQIVFGRSVSKELLQSAGKYKAFANMPDLRMITNHVSTVERNGAKPCRIKYDMHEKKKITVSRAKRVVKASRQPARKKATKKKAPRYTEEDYVSGKAPILDLYNDPMRFKMAKRVHEKIVKNTFPLTNEEKATISQIFTSASEILDEEGIARDLLGTRDSNDVGIFTDDVGMFTETCYRVMDNIRNYEDFNDLMTRGYMHMFFLHQEKCPNMESIQGLLDECSIILRHNESFKFGEFTRLQITPKLIFPSNVHIPIQMKILLDKYYIYQSENDSYSSLVLAALESIIQKGATGAKFVKAYYNGYFTAVDDNEFLVKWAMKLNTGKQQISRDFYIANQKDYSNLKLDK